jgi:hypothetical protein
MKGNPVVILDGESRTSTSSPFTMFLKEAGSLRSGYLGLDHEPRVPASKRTMTFDVRTTREGSRFRSSDMSPVRGEGKKLWPEILGLNLAEWGDTGGDVRIYHAQTLYFL